MINNINIVKSKFKRIKQDFFKTDLFENLEDNIQQQINNNIIYLDDEMPVLGYFSSIDNFWVLTNFRLINNFTKVLLDDIEKIEVPEIFKEGKSNYECNSIQIIKKDNTDFRLDLESSTWYAVLNVLQFVIIK
ncbi:hypothetical protein [Chryseobacterium indologenes]|uniref:Uncharacterized protein n=1 Tax=Chryseobacterium indologenes TaxID=253 RepID=A0AAD0YZC6_CHRID|nr:hypothetical protein [Chryseobacterium indologenes]ASE64063.1 hypothetical protein CEQ15_22655 [Chryseobacterium indologenes]AZB19851.1 hypothetical protein EG352_19845 [Chryseobacterium indologenes]VFA43729.1 Uncharacterised protein [Chryseobacterium indologenes]